MLLVCHIQIADNDSSLTRVDLSNQAAYQVIARSDVHSLRVSRSQQAMPFPK